MSSPGAVLITGGEGRLAATVAPGLAAHGWEVSTFGRRVLDVTDPEAVVDCLHATRATVILNLAAWTDLDGCEREPARAEAINARAVGHLREAARSTGAHLVHISSDYVFDGHLRRAYTEVDPAFPLNEYGTSKLHSESEAGPEATVLRTSWISGRSGRCLVRSALEAASKADGRAAFVADQVGSPTAADDLTVVLDQVARDRVAGLLHVAGQGEATPHDIATHVFREVGADPERVIAISSADRATGRSARRPRYAVLDSGAARSLGLATPGDWREAFSKLAFQLSSGRNA